MADSVTIRSPRLAAPPRVLGCDALVEAGFLSAPSTPEGALRRARALARLGKYQEARGLLVAHVRLAPAVLRPKISELLAECCVHVGGDWRSLADVALESYTAPADRARVLRILGEAQWTSGEFDAADENLRRSAELYQAAGLPVKAALSVSIRARVDLSAGYVTTALRRIDDALALLSPGQRPREEALIRLNRARILGYMAATSSSAKELICAERLLASSSNAIDRLRSRFARAEALFVLGEHERAAEGARRILADVQDVDDVAARAGVHTLLGRAMLRDDLADARRHLMRGKHLYEALNARFGQANCELWLTQVEHRLGFAVSGRLQRLSFMPLNEWPRFEAELRLVRAEVVRDHNPDLAQSMLDQSRHFGVESGNRALVRLVDEALRALGLRAPPEPMTSLEEDTEPTVQTVVTASQGAIPPGGPQRMVEGDSDDLDVRPPTKRPVRRAPITKVRTPTLSEGARRRSGVSSGRGLERVPPLPDVLRRSRSGARGGYGRD